MDFVRTQWLKPFRIGTLESNEKTVPIKPGIYVIMSLKAINRVGGIDRAGVLYVGKAFWLRSRLKKFLYADHIASYLLWRNLKIAQRVLGKKLLSRKSVEHNLGKVYTKVVTVERKELDTAERAVLVAYMYRYGELPPLNFSLRNRLSHKPSKQILRWAEQGIFQST